MMENRANVNTYQFMKNVSEAAFYVADLKLYLDTHPDDKDALRIFGEASRNYKACVDAFEAHCYPLFAASADCGCGWEWLIGVWPSEKTM